MTDDQIPSSSLILAIVPAVSGFADQQGKSVSRQEGQQTRSSSSVSSLLSLWGVCGVREQSLHTGWGTERQHTGKSGAWRITTIRWEHLIQLMDKKKEEAHKPLNKTARGLWDCDDRNYCSKLNYIKMFIKTIFTLACFWSSFKRSKFEGFKSIR